MHSLNIAQVRALAIAINGSPQRLLRFREFQKGDNIRPRKIVQDIRIRQNSTYLILRRAYQLRHYVDIQVEEYLENLKIQKIKLDESEQQSVLLIGNILNAFYKCTLIVLRTTNAGIHLGFRVFNYIFNYLETLKDIMTGSTYLYKSTILKAY